MFGHVALPTKLVVLFRHVPFTSRRCVCVAVRGSCPNKFTLKVLSMVWGCARWHLATRGNKPTTRPSSLNFEVSSKRVILVILPVDVVAVQLSEKHSGRSFRSFSGWSHWCLCANHVTGKFTGRATMLGNSWESVVTNTSHSFPSRCLKMS